MYPPMTIDSQKTYMYCTIYGPKNQEVEVLFYPLMKVLKLGPDMSYKKKSYKFKNAIEIEEFHNARYGAPGQKREEKKKLTPEQMEKVNQYNRERKARLKLRAHFEVNDYFTDLTYRKEDRPSDMKEAKEHFRKFIRIVRKEYKKRGQEVKWMRNIEVGTKNGWHIHLVINRIPDTDIILKKAWQRGRVVNELLYSKGEFRKLAAYIVKTPKTDKKLKEAHYSCSRNLPIPDPEVKVYRKWKTWGKIRIPKGFYLDKDTLHEGINPITGFRYRRYTLLRVRRE